MQCSYGRTHNSVTNIMYKGSGLKILEGGGGGWVEILGLVKHFVRLTMTITIYEPHHESEVLMTSLASRLICFQVR